MKKTENAKIFETFLKSINGLKYFRANKTITSRDFFEVDDGWLPLIQELIEKLIAAGWNKEILQVKEKFACLRFYVGNASGNVLDIINDYEKKSSITCEICGKPGKIHSYNNWLYTACDEHIKAK